VKLVGVVGAPLICGIENYALVPSDPSTVHEQGEWPVFFFDFFGIEKMTLVNLNYVILEI